MQVLTIPEVGQRLGMSRNTVYRLINSGDLRVVDVGAPKRKGEPHKPRMRIREDDLDAFIEARTVAPPVNDDALTGVP